jgi:hypothetical protein
MFLVLLLELFRQPCVVYLSIYQTFEDSSGFQLWIYTPGWNTFVTLVVKRCSFWLWFWKMTKQMTKITIKRTSSHMGFPIFLLVVLLLQWNGDNCVVSAKVKNPVGKVCILLLYKCCSSYRNNNWFRFIKYFLHSQLQLTFFSLNRLLRQDCSTIRLLFWYQLLAGLLWPSNKRRVTSDGSLLMVVNFIISYQHIYCIYWANTFLVLSVSRARCQSSSWQGKSLSIVRADCPGVIKLLPH